MWISKLEYEELVKSRNHWKEYYDHEVACRHSLLTNYNSAFALNDKLNSENIDLKNKLEEYKQKYADEVNKRLELIQYYEGFNSKSMG